MFSFFYSFRNKCVSYLDRAEKLKQYLAGKDDKKKHKPVKDSGADKDTDSDGEDAEDAEKKKKYQRKALRQMR